MAVEKIADNIILRGSEKSVSGPFSCFLMLVVGKKEKNTKKREMT